MELKDGFKGHCEAPYLKILHTEARFDPFLKWMKGLDFVIWVHIHSWIVRSPNAGGMFGNYLYHEYFIKRKLLAASTGLENIAKSCGTSKSRVIKCICNLTEKGFLEVEHIKKDGMIYNIYILGTHDGFQHELLFVRKHFVKSLSSEYCAHEDANLLRKVEGSGVTVTPHNI